MGSPYWISLWIAGGRGGGGQKDYTWTFLWTLHANPHSNRNSFAFRWNSPCQQDEYSLVAKYECGVRQDHIPNAFAKHIYCESTNEQKFQWLYFMRDAWFKGNRGGGGCHIVTDIKKYYGVSSSWMTPKLHGKKRILRYKENTKHLSSLNRALLAHTKFRNGPTGATPRYSTYRDMTPGAVQSWQRVTILNRLATFATFSWTVALDPVMVHRLR